MFTSANYRVHVDEFALRGELRGQGVGSLMLAMLDDMARAQGCGLVAGQLVERDKAHHDRLARLYTRHGYNVIRHTSTHGSAWKRVTFPTVEAASSLMAQTVDQP